MHFDSCTTIVIKLQNIPTSHESFCMTYCSQFLPPKLLATSNVFII